VTEREVILPLIDVSIAVWHNYQKQHSLPEAEEVSDFLLACLRGNAPDMDCVRHVEGFATEKLIFWRDSFTLGMFTDDDV
jgi:hypothetical protein